jgi:hypothetical protein
MPRSATDATRFTSTTPHASAKPPASNLNLPGRGNIPLRKPGPPGETPQEKVRRLRAAADRARDAQISTLDKVLVRGRVWADRAHRFTALSLIGATGMPVFLYNPSTLREVGNGDRIGANWCVCSSCGRLHLLCLGGHDDLQSP